MRKSGIVAAAIASVFLGRCVMGAALTPGDLLISYDGANYGIIEELTTSGKVVETFNVPYTVDDGGVQLRGLTVDSQGYIDVFNATFSPTISRINPTTKAVTTISGTNFSVGNEGGAGNVAAYGSYLYVPDQNTGGSPANGIIRFNTTTGTSQEFAMGYDYTKVIVGQNGLLYGLAPDGYSSVDIFDPVTLAKIGRVNFSISPADFRGVGVAANGDIFASEYGGIIYEFSPTGAELNSLTIPNVDLLDLSLSSTGQIAVTDRGGNIYLTTTALSSYTTISPVDGGGYLSFVSLSVPEPTTLGVAGLAGIVLLRRRSRVA